MSDEEVLEADLGDQEMDLPVSALTGAEVDETFGLPVVNTTGVSNEEVFEALQRENGQIMAQLGVWAQSLQASQFGQGGASRSGGIMARDAYLTPDKIYDQIVTAQKAAEDDDVTGGYIEATESLAFSSVSMFAEDPDEQDIYNQVVGDLELDARLREIWREVVTYSQVYMAVWWRKKTYKVKRKPTKGGAQRRKTYTLDVPVAMELLDPLKVVPVQVGHYGGARLAYCASRGEAENITNVLENKKGATDKFVKAMIEGPYEASRDEQKALKEAGFPASNLFLFKEGVVFRHTLTKPNYARWANVRMKSIFELLDAKRQLRQMDRAYLLGGTNFLVVVTKGTDALPASPAEVDNLRTQVRTVHRLPVLVGDHRLKVEIVTPKMDNTLKAERYNTIDSRITARLYQIMSLGNYCQSEDTEILTADGWKTHDQLQAGDSVLTLDTKTQSSVWQSCLSVNRFDHDGLMLSMEGRSHSSLSTANHRWWVDEQYGADQQWRRKFVTSAELSHRHRIPTAIPHADFPTEPKYSDAFVELVGWYWTEGWLMSEIKDGRRSRRAGCALGQSHVVNPGKVDRIRSACEAAFGPPAPSHWRENAGLNGMTTFTFNHELFKVFDAVCPDKIPSPEFLRSLTSAQLKLFIDTSVAADGHVESTVYAKRTFAQKDQRGVDAFIMACALAGISTSSHVDRNGLTRITLQTTTTTNPVRALYHRKGQTGKSGKPRVEWVHYKGIVWCPTTPNGTWLARRNGTVFWTGNSAGASGDDSVKLVKVIARGMESRRHMIRRTLEKYIFDEMYRRNERTLKTRPRLQFHPQSIALDFDQALASFLLDLRASREISRETLLSQFDLSQSHEALMLQREEEEFDDIFQTLAPPGSPGTVVKLGRDNGGGNRNGGGAAPGTGQGQPARNPRRRSDRGRDLPEIESNLQVVGADGEVVELTAEQIELIEKVVENA